MYAKLMRSAIGRYTAWCTVRDRLQRRMAAMAGPVTAGAGAFITTQFCDTNGDCGDSLRARVTSRTAASDRPARKLSTARFE